ncbi:MAG: hypothetical protein LBE92_15345 [Chryseobacterium sp.]|jgi:hypothetical protein|nr:hypothetical protein [Chryseobacterium sp.]MDR2237494.1 hypothetical protein [Chryseobacterium sp.]
MKNPEYHVKDFMHTVCHYPKTAEAAPGSHQIIKFIRYLIYFIRQLG